MKDRSGAARGSPVKTIFQKARKRDPKCWSCRKSKADRSSDRRSLCMRLLRGLVQPIRSGASRCCPALRRCNQLLRRRKAQGIRRSLDGVAGVRLSTARRPERQILMATNYTVQCFQLKGSKLVSDQRNRRAAVKPQLNSPSAWEGLRRARWPFPRRWISAPTPTTNRGYSIA